MCGYRQHPVVAQRRAEALRWNITENGFTCEKCGNRCERPNAKYCEECSYDLIGEEVEKHPLGGHLGRRGRGQGAGVDHAPSAGPGPAAEESGGKTS